MAYDGTVKKVAEFINEASFGTLPADPDFVNFGGYVSKASVKKSMVPVKIPYLKDDDDTNRLQSTKTEKVSEAFAATITMNPVDWSILPYILKGATASTYAIGDTNYDIALGTILDDQFEIYGGGCWNKYTCTIAEDSAAEAVVDGMFANTTGVSGTDYVTGAGTHMSTPTGDAIKFGDLATVLYDAATTAANGITIDSIVFGIETPVKPVKDAGSSNNSNIAGWSYGQRNINLDLTMTLVDTTVVPDILDGAAHTFAFTVGAKTLTFSNIIWEGDVDTEFSPDDLIAMPFKAANVDLVIS